MRVLALVALAACGDNQVACDTGAEMCKRLSFYGFFDDLATQQPAPGVLPYGINTPLFSDYATKDRFLVLPPGTTASWRDPDALDLPTGTVLIKTFSYLHDRRDPSLGRTLLETRLLVHDAAGWHGASYVYDPGGGDASLAVAGATIDASWIHDDGTPRTNSYQVPNQNQCKLCHAEHDGVLTPLGPKARHVNTADAPNVLDELVADGELVGAPPRDGWPRAPVATDPSTGTLDQRARAWLDINCGHCHNPSGAARPSGLYLDITQTDPAKLGLCKPPVAAGKGTGGLQFDIAPGQPDQSILVFRISSTEPEIKMPQVGRNLVHEEGVALIRAWIAAMPGGCGAGR